MTNIKKIFRIFRDLRGLLFSYRGRAMCKCGAENGICQ
jgi:hypothetical protein